MEWHRAISAAPPGAALLFALHRWFAPPASIQLSLRDILAFRTTPRMVCEPQYRNSWSARDKFPTCVSPPGMMT
jgi:hypothetical protein